MLSPLKSPSKKLHSCLVTLPLIRMFQKHSKTRSRWSLDSLFSAREMSVFGNSRRDNFRLGVSQKLVKLLKVGRRAWGVESRARGPLRKTQLISLQLTVDYSQEC